MQPGQTFSNLFKQSVKPPNRVSNALSRQKLPEAAAQRQSVNWREPHVGASFTAAAFYLPLSPPPINFQLTLHLPFSRHPFYPTIEYLIALPLNSNLAFAQTPAESVLPADLQVETLTRRGSALAWAALRLEL